MFGLIFAAHLTFANNLEQCQYFYDRCVSIIAEKQEEYNICLLKKKKNSLLVIPISRANAQKFNDPHKCDEHLPLCGYNALAWQGAVNAACAK
jgi:hypothetical protein